MPFLEKEVVVSRTALPTDWAAGVAVQGLDVEVIDDIVDRAYVAPTTTWPTESAVFRAFELTPLDRVRVVVVGQDPYPSAADATGVAFSTGPRGAVRDALKAFYANLSSDPAFAAPSHGDLTEWAERGALLLNAALTLSATSLDMRCSLWRPLLRAALAAVSATGKPIPVVLLGGRAVALRAAVKDPAAVQAAGHPTPRNKRANQFPLFEDARPFRDANAFLMSRGQAPFDWSLAP